MTRLDTELVAPSTTLHGKGDLGGKGEGLLLVAQQQLEGVQQLRTEVFTTDLYDRFRHNNNEFDEESREHLREVHSSFTTEPIGVRSSEEFENDPWIPTSGLSVSYMLPNCHVKAEERYWQFELAIRYIFSSFTQRMAEEGKPDSKIAIVVNPIPGVATQTKVGELFYPMSSGVADSFFKHPLTLDTGPQDPQEGFARVAFGHGYGVVRDDFEVIPLATIRNPLNPSLLSKRGQKYFYGLRLDQQRGLEQGEMSTMSLLHMRFANPEVVRHFEGEKRKVDFTGLVSDDQYGYRRGLTSIMEQLEKTKSPFQIEFTWNLVDGKGVFHVVQYKRLRNADRENFRVPDFDGPPLVTTRQVQGHGKTRGIRYAVVINPFNYSEEMHDDVVAQLGWINDDLRERNEKYIFVCPGRLGSTNRRWGFEIEFKNIDNAAAIVEYGYDIEGGTSIEPEKDELTGGVYGSHFLYQILGGADEAERRRKARIFGSQGSHFLTNLYTAGALYFFVDPNRDYLAKWFFSPPSGRKDAAVYCKEFDRPMTAYGNLFDQQCVVGPTKDDTIVLRSEPSLTKPASLRIINPQRVNRVFIFAANKSIRKAGSLMGRHLADCEVTTISDPADLTVKLYDSAFVLFVEEASIPFLERAEFKSNNPYGAVALLSYDLRVGSAPTREEVIKVCPSARKAELVAYVNEEDCRPLDVMPSVVRYAEDLHNIQYHRFAKRFIFLVVDDELRWFSQFLPVLYQIIGQRASVMLARTFEEAQAIMDDHGTDIVCLITDMFFPKDGVISADAGRELVIATKQKRPRIPIIIASKAEQGRELQDSALILPKGDLGTVATLRRYVHNFTGLGSFLFYQGTELWRRASTLRELRDAVADAPHEMLDEYGAKDYFSTWLYMHGFEELADSIRDKRVYGEELRELLLSSFSRELDIVEKQELVFSNEKKEIIGKAKTVGELAEVIRNIDAETLAGYADRDLFSLWLMRKGYPDLADAVRPIHGGGEQLRGELLGVLDRWCAQEY